MIVSWGLRRMGIEFEFDLEEIMGRLLEPLAVKGGMNRDWPLNDMANHKSTSDSSPGDSVRVPTRATPKVVIVCTHRSMLDFVL